MPRIEKVRIVGVHYDSMRKHYGDMTLDLANGVDPAHTLLTLMNGGGKGLLLQMIFQLLHPLTRWGAKSENRIEALFYNERRQFVPYTFHVVIEWRLDTDPVKWLLTGIAVSAREKASANESDLESVEPRHALYTLEQLKPGQWELEDLPLTVSGSGEAVSLDDWKEFLQSRKTEFTLHNQTRDYYELLKTYDIDRKEWQTMRDINRQEGGVEAYFSKGLDNHSLFHDLIIPEIGKHMTGTDEEGNPRTLLDIFRHSAAIARQLPKLLRREEGYRSVLEWLAPLQESLQRGAVQEEAWQALHQEGGWLRRAMLEWQAAQGSERERWLIEVKQLEEEYRKLLYEADNVEYASKKRELMLLTAEIEQLAAQLAAEGHRLELCEEDERVSHAVLLWNERRVVERKLEGLREELALLQNSEEHKHLQEQHQQLVGKANEDWPVVLQAWQEEAEGYRLLSAGFDHTQNGFESSQKKLAGTIEEKSRQIGRVNGQLQDLNTEKIEMERTYGRLVNTEPERLIGQLLKGREQLETKQRMQRVELAEWNEQLQRYLAELSELGAELKQNRKQAEQWSVRLSSRIALERERAQQLAVYLKLELEQLSAASWKPDRAWWIEIRSLLVSELERLDNLQNRAYQKLWTHELDASLAQEAFWIPNPEALKLKEELSEQGLQVFHGTELLLTLSEEEQQSYRNAYPLLPYGLVVLDVEWKKRDRNKLRKLLLRNPVPIYLRSGMNRSLESESQSEAEADTLLLSDGGRIIRETGLDMAANPEKWQEWRSALYKQVEVLKETGSAIRSTIKEGQEHGERLSTLLDQPDSTTLGRELEDLRHAELAGVTAEQDILVLKRSTEEKLQLLREELELGEQELTELSSKLKQLEAWQERLVEGARWQQQKSALSDELIGWKREVEALAGQETELKTKRLSWETMLIGWRHDRQQALEQIRQAIPEAEYTFHAMKREAEASSTVHAADRQGQSFAEGISVEVDLEQQVEALFLRQSAGPLLNIIQHIQVLTAGMEEKNGRLKELRISLQYEHSYLDSKEAELTAIDRSWRQQSYPDKAIELAERDYEAAKGIKREAERARFQLELKLKGLEGECKSDKKRTEQLEKEIKRKHGITAEEWPEADLGQLEADIGLRMEANRKQHGESRVLLSGLDRTLTILDTQLKVLASQRISEDAARELPASIRQEIRLDPSEPVRLWLEKSRTLESSRREIDQHIAQGRDRFIRQVREGELDAELSGSLQQMLMQVRWDEYGYARDLLLSVSTHARQELDHMAEDREKAEQARDLWTDRACYRVLNIARALKQMTSRMTFVNAGGHRYPLVQMDIRQGDLPEKSEDIQLLLREYFVRNITELTEKYADFEDIPHTELEERMSDSRVVLTALKNRYPVLRIYKPQTTNVFLYESPKKSHYTEWETLNKGSVTEAKGSGGQLLAARTIVMMMLMTYKRQIRQGTQWSVLISDNPFGQAVSPHVLDPIFAIAENLHFQWIVLAPPELIKLDVSRRFPVFWELELKRQTKGETVTERLQHGGRAFEGQLGLFD